MLGIYARPMYLSSRLNLCKYDSIANHTIGLDIKQDTDVRHNFLRICSHVFNLQIVFVCVPFIDLICHPTFHAHL